MGYYTLIPYLSMLTSISLLAGTLIFIPPTSYLRVLMLAVMMVPVVTTIFTVKYASNMDIYNQSFGIIYGTEFVFEMFDLVCVSRASFDGNEHSDDYPNLPWNIRAKLATYWALDMLFNKRRIGRPNQVKNLPVFDRRNPNRVVSRRELLTFRTIRFALIYILTDFSSNQVIEDAVIKFAPGKEKILSRLMAGDMSGPDMAEAAGAVVGFGAIGGLSMLACHDLVSILMVGLLGHDPASWPPLFGPISEAYSIRRFWGILWHQNFQVLYKSLSSFFTHTVLGIPQPNNHSGISRFISRYLNMQFAFLISGLIHVSLDLMLGIPLNESGVVTFFSFQAFGICIEDTACTIYRWLSSKTDSATAPVNSKRGEDIASSQQRGPKLWIKLLGFAWLAMWMFWCVPVWLFPQLRRTPPTVVPFSYFAKH